jgi:hypothetical protein
MPVDRSDRAWIDFVHQRIQASRRPVTVPPHVDTGAKPARGRDEPNILFANNRLAVLAPLVDEFGAALLLDVIVRGDGVGLGGHRTLPGPFGPA